MLEQITVSPKNQNSGEMMLTDFQGDVWSDCLEKKQPKNDYERIALIVNYLIRRQNSEGVTVSDIIDFIRQNPDDFSNVKEDALKKAIGHTKNNEKYGYIEFANKKGKKYYRLSVKGNQLIRTLPDRLKIRR